MSSWRRLEASGSTCARTRLRSTSFARAHTSTERPRALTGTRVIPNKTLTWAIATYDGAHLKTYIADGDGSNLVLDNSVAQTGTVATGATITGIDENLVVGAKHRMGHLVDGTGTENLEGFFNGTMSRFIVFNTALTQSEIASVISGSVPSGKPGPVQAHFIQKSVVSSGVHPTVPYRVSWTQGTCPTGSTYNVTATTGGISTVVHSGTALSAKINLAVGAAYTIAVDCGGGSSTTSLTSTGYQEGAASYTGTWRSTSFAGAWGGAARYTAAASASATFHFTGSNGPGGCCDIAWIPFSGAPRRDDHRAATRPNAPWRPGRPVRTTWFEGS